MFASFTLAKQSTLDSCDDGTISLHRSYALARADEKTLQVDLIAAATSCSVAGTSAIKRHGPRRHPFHREGFNLCNLIDIVQLLESL